MTEWQPIETAPKGKMVLVYEDEYQEYYVAENIKGVWQYASTSIWPRGTFKQNIDFVCMPTHWMPLPEPPKQEAK